MAPVDTDNGYCPPRREMLPRLTISVFKKGKRRAISGLDLFINTVQHTSTSCVFRFYSVILLFESSDYHSLITLYRLILIHFSH